MESNVGIAIARQLEDYTADLIDGGGRDAELLRELTTGDPTVSHVVRSLTADAIEANIEARATRRLYLERSDGSADALRQYHRMQLGEARIKSMILSGLMQAARLDALVSESDMAAAGETVELVEAIARARRVGPPEPDQFEVVE